MSRLGCMASDGASYVSDRDAVAGYVALNSHFGLCGFRVDDYVIDFEVVFCK